MSMTNSFFALSIVGISCLALIYAFFRSQWISKQDPGNERMQKIAKYIAEGAMNFLKAEYKVLLIFVVVVGILLTLSANKESSHAVIGLAFAVGAFLSALAGFIGMRVA